MLHTNLVRLRKHFSLTQEQVAEKINVSRQAVAKWESGASLPDLNSCIALAKLYGVAMDDLVHYSEGDSHLMVPPKGKFFFGSVTVGERGQIVIPKKAREIFDIKPGDQLVILGDIDRGLGIVHQDHIMDFIEGAGVMGRDREKGENNDL